jgi:hypothetical protein
MLLFKQEGESLHLDLNIEACSSQLRSIKNWSISQSTSQLISYLVSQSAGHSVWFTVTVSYLWRLPKINFPVKVTRFTWLFGASRFSGVLNNRSRKIVALGFACISFLVFVTLRRKVAEMHVFVCHVVVRPSVHMQQFENRWTDFYKDKYGIQF